MKSDLIDITVHLLHETDRAVLVTDSTPEQGVWLPRSQIDIEPAGLLHCGGRLGETP